MKELVKPAINERLLNDIKKLIQDSKNFVAVTANATLTILFWRIG